MMANYDYFGKYTSSIMIIKSKWCSIWVSDRYVLLPYPSTFGSGNHVWSSPAFSSDRAPFNPLSLVPGVPTKARFYARFCIINTILQIL